MLRRVLRSKIHRATVTQADVHYEGSITIPPQLMKLAGLVEYEAVMVWDVTNGNRLETYAITGNTNHEICINGAAANLVDPGDLVIIACFGYLNSDEVHQHDPKLIFVDEHNQFKELRKEVPGPQLLA